MLAKEGDVLRTNVIEGLSKTTLDVIGLAGQSPRIATLRIAKVSDQREGFDYNLDSLQPGSENNELNQAIRQLFKKPPNMKVSRVLMDYVPALDIFVSRHCRTS